MSTVRVTGRDDTAPAGPIVLTVSADLGSVAITTTTSTEGDVMPSGVNIAAAARQLAPLPVQALREALARKHKRIADSAATRPRPGGIPLPVRTTPGGLEVFDADEWDAYTLDYLPDVDGRGRPVVPDGTRVIGYDLIAAWLDRETQTISRMWWIRNRHLRGLGCDRASCCPTPEAAAVRGPRWDDIVAAVGRRGIAQNDGPVFLPEDIARFAMSTGKLDADGVTPAFPPPIGRLRQPDSQRSQARRRRTAVV